MEKLAFNNDKYFAIQREEIIKRIQKFNNKLYLEIGGKLFDDLHASRVLPGFKPDTKMQMLLEFKEQAEIIICLNCNDIESNKIRNDIGITYEQEAERLIDVFRDYGLSVNSVCLTFYHNSKNVQHFINTLEKNNIKVYKHYEIRNYATAINITVSKIGFGKNDYIETTKPLVIVTAPGPNSGKLACCLSQLYNDSTKGIMSGYAKFETFPIWNLSLDHPVNLAYEAATVDINDHNEIDPYHYKAYGSKVVNYNRDIEAYPILNSIFRKIYGESPYKSPTEMGVNMLGYAIENDNVAIKAAQQEIIRRYYQAMKYYHLGTYDETVAEKAKLLISKAKTNIKKRNCVKPCLEKAELEGVSVIAIETKDKIITGKTSELLTSSAAVLLNTLKHFANIDDSIDLIDPKTIDPIKDLKINNLGHHNTKLHAEEVLVILSIQSLNDKNSKLALDQLPKLKYLEAHSSEILPQVDLNTFKKLKINITEEPKTHASKVFLDNNN